jgi:hypothetical protein
MELWRSGLLPATDGLYRADGSARSVDVDGPKLSWLDLGAPLNLDALLAADPEDVFEFDVCAEAVVPDGSGYVCCGDGAMGADGFFARLDPRRDLVWVVTSTKTNPFMRVSVEGSLATFTNNVDSSVTVDLAGPDYF